MDDKVESPLTFTRECQTLEIQMLDINCGSFIGIISDTIFSP